MITEQEFIKLSRPHKKYVMYQILADIRNNHSFSIRETWRKLLLVV